MGGKGARNEFHHLKVKDFCLSIEEKKTGPKEGADKRDVERGQTG